MSKFLTIGEPLVVFASQNLNENLENSLNFKKFSAGAELNVAIGVARLGHTSYYVSKIGNDSNGKFLLNTLKKEKIKTEYIDISNKYKTGFYLKQLVDNNDPVIEYYRKNSAASNYNKDNLKNIDFSNIKIAHISGIMASISKKGLNSIKSLMNILNNKNILTVFDPNLRPILWDSKDLMIKTLNNLAKKANIVLPGISEAKILTGLNNMEDICDFYLNQSKKTKIVIIKNGSKGAFVKEKNKKSFEVKAYKMKKIIDTVGAGDGFAVGIITGLMENLTLDKAVKRACAIGALATQSQGDNSSYPTRKELDIFMKGEK